MTQVTVTGTFQDGAGTPNTGRVMFRLAAAATNGTVIFTAHPISALLDATGSIEVDLQATDELTTDGDTYQVKEMLNGTATRTYYIELPATPGEQDLADLATWDEPPNVVYQPTLGLAALNAHINETFPRTWDNMPSPFYLSHSGMDPLLPENTMNAFRAGFAALADGLEFDARMLLDGSLGVMHDATVDRTTSGTGNVADYTASQFQALTIDSSTWLAPYPNNDHPPLVAEVLAEFGSKWPLILEQKVDGATGPAMFDLFDKYGLHESMILHESANAAECVLAKAAGWRTNYYGTPPSIASAIAGGFDYVSIENSSLTQELVDQAQAADIGVIAYTIKHRWQLDAAEALGVDGYMCDDITYIKETSNTTTDLFAGGSMPPGSYAAGTTAIYGTFPTAGSWGFTLSGADTNHCRFGHLTPPNPSNFTMTFKAKISSINSADATRWGGVFLGTTDRVYGGDGASGTTLTGYSFLFRKNGTLQVYKFANNASTSLGTASITAPTLGTDYTYTITITPTTVEIVRSDVPGTPATFTDSTYRGLHTVTLGRAGAEVYFNTITLA